MLPPIPQGLVPVTVQQDPVKQRPDVPPVAPSQGSAQTDDVSLQKNNSEVRERMREEQRRQQKAHKQTAEETDVEEDDKKQAEQAKKDGIPRCGLWIDVKV